VKCTGRALGGRTGLALKKVTLIRVLSLKVAQLARNARDECAPGRADYLSESGVQVDFATIERTVADDVTNVRCSPLLE
jgi:hypothetical protein